MSAPRIRYYLNVRATLILAAFGLASALGLYALWGYQANRVLRIAKKQIETFVETVTKTDDSELKLHNNDLALRHLIQYLDFRPNDPEALELEGQLLTGTTDLHRAPSVLKHLLDQSQTGTTDLRGAAPVYEHLLRVLLEKGKLEKDKPTGEMAQDPMGEMAQDARRHLAAIYVLISDSYRFNPLARLDPEQTARQYKYLTAEEHASVLLQGNANARPPVDDGEAHLLHAMALEGQIIPTGDSRKVEVFVPHRPVEKKLPVLEKKLLPLEEATVVEYQTAMKLDRSDTIASQRLAEIYRKSGNMLAASQVLDDLLKAQPHSVKVRSVRYRFFRSTGDTRAAAAELEEAALLDPEDPEDPEKLGLILMAAENALQSGSVGAFEPHFWLDQISRGSRDIPRVLLMEGMVECREQKFDAALATWRKGLARNNAPDVELTRQLALLLLELGRDDEAAKIVEQYRRLVSDTDPVLRLLEGTQDEHAGRFSRAIERLESALGRLPEAFRIHVYLILARCHEKQGDSAKAEAIYRAGLRGDPKSLLLRQLLGQLLLAKQPEEAAREFEQLLVSRPNQPVLLMRLAEARLRQQKALPQGRRNWSDFDAVFKRATAVVPTNIAIALLNAERLAADARLDQAISFLKEVVAKIPSSPDLAVRLAEYLLGQGRADQALEVLTQASDPKAAGDRGLLRIQRARILTSLGQGREARTVLIRDVNRLPPADRDEVWGFLFLLCKIQGNPETIRATYDEWLRLLPDDLKSKFALLDLAIEANDQKVIRARLESLRPSNEQGDFLWLLVQARLRLMEAKKAPDEKSRRAILKDADALVEKVLHDFKIDTVALLLKGQILEEEGAVERAADTYGQAWDRGNADALLRLVSLWTRLGRKPELERLRQSDKTKQLDQLEAMAFLNHGDKIEALRIAEQSLAENPGSQSWQVGILEFLGEEEKAESSLRTTAEQQSDKLDPWLALLRFQASHRPAQPAKVEATIAEIKKRVPFQWPELLEGECRRIAADWPAADKAFDAAAKRYPDVRNVQSAASLYYEQRGRLDAAEACLRRILSHNPDERGAVRNLAVVLASQGDRPGAWKQALELLGPESPKTNRLEERLARAIVLGRSGDLTYRKQAIDILQALVADLPAENTLAATVRDVLTRLLLDNGLADQASKLAGFTAARGNNPAAVALYAETLLRSRQFDAAEEQGKRLERLDPGNPFITYLRARLILGRAKPTEAAAALENAYLARENSTDAEPFGREIFSLIVGMGPDAQAVAGRVARRLAEHNPALSWMTASILASQKKRDEAFALCRTAIEAGTQPQPVDLLEACRIALELAVASPRETTPLQRASDLVDAALRRTPAFDGLRMIQAMINHLQGRFDQEVAHYRALLVNQPRNFVVLNNLAWALSEGLNQPSEALEKIDELLAIQGPNAENLDTRGVILIRLGRLEEAVKDLEEAVKAASNSTRLYHLAKAYKKMGRDTEFRKTLEEAKQAGLTATTPDPTERADIEVLLKL